MSSDSNHSGFVVDEVYHKSYADLNQLHAQLPQDTVSALAREVLKRLANNVNQPAPSNKAIVALAKALIDPDAKAAATLVETRYNAGAPFNEIYLNYLGPAAALLGEWWESDEVTFSHVTAGTGRIYAIMRTLNSRIKPNQVPDTRSAIFAGVPGEDHQLGLKMAVDLARKKGWEIEAHLDSEHDKLVEDITASGQLLIGLSAGGIHALPNLARLIVALRISVPNAKILLSGNIIDVAKDQIALLGVDGVARSFDDAMNLLDQLWLSFQTKTQ